jgi:hypothetical protein
MSRAISRPSPSFPWRFHSGISICRFADWKRREEAVCKELVKARFGRSGMRRKRDTGSPVLQLSAIKLSKLWDSFGPMYYVTGDITAHQSEMTPV